MPSKKPIITLRTDQETIEKLKNISEREKRSSNKQLEQILQNFIEQYEREHGEINISRA